MFLSYLVRIGYNPAQMGWIFPKEIKVAYTYLIRTRTSRTFFLMLVVLSTLVAMINLYLVTLVFPLIRGIVARDFFPIQTLFGFHYIVSRFPEYFSRQWTVFALLVFAVYAVSILKSVLGYLRSVYVRREAAVSANHLRLTILDRYLSFGKLFFDRTDISSLAWQATNCGRWIEGLFLSFQNLLSAFLELLVYFAILLSISWQLTCAVIIIVPLLQLANLLLSRIHAIATNYQRSLAHLHTRLTQLLSTLTLVRSNGQTEKERQQFQQLCSEEVHISLRMQRFISLIEPITEMSGTTGVFLVAVALSLYLRHGEIKPDDLFIFLFIVMRAIPAVDGMSRWRTSLVQDTAAAEGLDSIMSNDDKHMVIGGSKIFSGTFENIEIRHLRFQYLEKMPVLSDVSLSVKQGEVLGIVGPTGAGKTTLINLLFRFYDCPPGSIFINDIDIREFDIDSLRRHMALVSQDAPVFNDTIRANIMYAAPHGCTPAQLDDVLEKSHLAEFVSRLPMQLDTIVGESGMRISGGERQRIAIARALLKEASLLVLDEPTSALDPENERLITSAMKNVMKGKTTIVIAHRLSTIRSAGHIVFIQDGRVVQEGTFDQLMTMPGPFHTYAGS